MPQQDKIAILAHGFADSYENPWWKNAENKLEEIGYDVRKADFDGLARTVDSPSAYSGDLKQEIETAKREGGYDPEDIVLVTHSKGGIIARYLTEVRGYDSYDTLVSIQSPHKGSGVADKFSWFSDGTRDLSTGSDFMQELNSGGLSEEVEYVNIYAPNDPVIPRSENARLPEGYENVENIKVGQNLCEVVNETSQDIIHTGTQIAKDAIRDAADAFELLTKSITDPIAPFKSENRLRAFEPKLVGLRTQQLRNAATPEEKDLFTGHVTALYNDETWDEIESHLETR